MRPPLFLFGSLCHLPFFEALIGDLTHLTLSPARLRDFAVTSSEEGFLSRIQAEVGSETQGLVVSGLTDANWTVLESYEGLMNSTLTDVLLSDGTPAGAYVATAEHQPVAQPWDLDQWVAQWGAIAVPSAHELRDHVGCKTPQELQEMMPMILARAASSLNAKKSRHGAETFQGDVDVVALRRPYTKYFGIDEYDLRHRRFDGAVSPVLSRAVFRAPDAVIVLPYDARRDRVLLVEQFRIGPLARGDRTLWQLEAVAGRLDPGETPEDAARREAMEEAGLEMGPLHAAGEVYCASGNSSEFLYLFVAEADLPDTAAGIGGLAFEDEDIKSHLLHFDALMDMCDQFELTNAPLLTLAFWLARHRARLRAQIGASRP